MVASLAAEHPEVRAEIDAIENALETYAAAHAVMPPPSVKARILQNLDTPPAKPVLPANPTVRPFPLMRLLALAALALAVVFGILYLQSFNDLRRLDDQARQLREELRTCQEQTSRQDQLKQQVAMLRDPDTRMIRLADNPEDPKVSAYVYFNPVRQETALDLNSLPAPPGGHYFQFWAIVDGKAESMGMVQSVDKGTWQVFSYRRDVQAFAISAEDNPKGHDQPTMVVMQGRI